MKVKCDKRELEAGLKTVARACSRSTWIPVLENVLFSAQGCDGRLELRCTDLELQISIWIDAEILRPGTTTVPLRVLRKLLKTLPKGQLELAVVGTQFSVSTGGTTYNLVATESNQFPSLKLPGEPTGLLLDLDTLRSGLRHTLFAAGDDEGRPTLMGVLTKVENDQLTLVTTDGFRLSVYTTSVSYDGEPVEVIIPARAFAGLARIGKKQKGFVTILVGQGRFAFQLTDSVLVGSSIEGNYPRYEEIIPYHCTTSVIVDTARLLGACKAALVFADGERAYAVTLRMGAPNETEPGSLTLSPHGAGSEGGTCELPAVITGQELKIHFNAKYLIDVLSAVESPEVALDFSTHTSPVLLRENESFVHVLMPIDPVRL